MESKTPYYFLIFSICALLLGMFFGLTASLQYVLPDFLKEILPFSKLRPFHTTTVISWIILAATGSIYFYISKVEKLKIYSKLSLKLHLGIFLLTGIGIYISYAFGFMQGREYLAFTPILIIPILLGWLLFGFNYFKTLHKKVVNWPVYYWMWGTGIVFMTYHLCEAHLWLFDYFRQFFVKDMAVQWKSYGSFTGSWNMLVYGISIYVMSKIKGGDALARSKTAFFFYFLGLTNLMFGWAHHTYMLPTQPWIRYVAYGISMTEWVVLGSMILSWKKSLGPSKKEAYPMAYRFLMATDFWIFLNLILALLFSIPAINFFTHGTHVTVAHSMGTTIGINTTILLSSLLFILSKVNGNFNTSQLYIRRGFQLFNVSLFFFWCALLAAGIKKSYWMYVVKEGLFSEMQEGLIVVYSLVFVFGIGLFVSMLMIAIPMLREYFRQLHETKTNLQEH